MPTPADRLRALLERPGSLVMPGCHDALTARLIEESGFEIGFTSGFGVSVARLGMPDTDARGRWEGDTLVVETRNFRDDSVYRGANPITLKIVERFTSS